MLTLTNHTAYAPDAAPGSVTNEGDEGDTSVTVVVPPADPEPVPAAPALVIDPQPSELEGRVRALETGAQNVQAALVEIRQELAQRATVEHEHGTDPVVASLVDNLREIEAEEVAPKKRQSFLFKPLFGGNR